MTREDFAGEQLEVFPDNKTIFLIFCSMSTQWRVSYQAYIGLDYNVLYHKLDRMNLSQEEYAEYESDFHTLETAALQVINKPAT